MPFVFDINVLIEVVLEKNHYSATQTLLSQLQNKGEELWLPPAGLAYASSILPTTQSHEKFSQLLQLFSTLPYSAKEQQALYQQSPQNYYQQLLYQATLNYLPHAIIITANPMTSTTDNIKIQTPTTALKQLTSPTDFHPNQFDFIDLKTQQRQCLPEIEYQIHQVLKHGQYILGKEMQQLEQQLATFTQVEYALTCASGTDALIMALMALDIGKGDEVITTSFSFIATAEVIAFVGAKPVFIDIDANTYNLQANAIEQAITPNTKAIIAVSLYGQCADFHVINDMAKKHNLAVIEDAAQSFGATYHQKPSCGLTTIACTSFFPAKPFGCYGDGGACFTNDEALYKAMQAIRVHGQSQRYSHDRFGINGRFDTLQAGILLAKWTLFVQQEIPNRQRLAEYYNQALQNTVTIPYIAPENTSVYAQYTIQCPQRDSLQTHLQQQGIPTAVHYPIALHQQPVFQHLNTATLPIAEQLSQQVISLPMHPYLTKKQQDNVINAILQFFA